MFTLRLHAIGRNGPGLCLKVDLVPLRLKHFAAPRGGQDQKFKREPCRNTFIFPQALNEGWHLSMGKSGKMFLRRVVFWQDLRDAIDGIIPRSKTCGFGPVKYRFYALSDSSRGF